MKHVIAASSHLRRPASVCPGLLLPEYKGEPIWQGLIDTATDLVGQESHSNKIFSLKPAPASPTFNHDVFKVEGDFHAHPRPD